MSRHPVLRLALGLLLLALALGCRAPRPRHRRRGERVPGPAGGVAARTPARRRPASPGLTQPCGRERARDPRARSDVLRAYQDYRAGLADVIEGTTYPADPRALRGDQGARTAAGLAPSGSDRASADVVLGVDPRRRGLERGAAAPDSAAQRARGVRTGSARGPGERDGEARSRGAAPGHGAASEEPGQSLRLAQPAASARREPPQPDRARARGRRGVLSPMPLLAQLVFLTPRAALVGLAFVAPLAALALRERAQARVRSTLELRRPRPARMLVRACRARGAGGCWSRQRQPSRLSGPRTRRRCAPTRSCTSRSTSAARCSRPAPRAASPGWSVPALSGATSTRPSPTSRPASRRSRTG